MFDKCLTRTVALANREVHLRTGGSQAIASASQILYAQSSCMSRRLFFNLRHKSSQVALQFDYNAFLIHLLIITFLENIFEPILIDRWCNAVGSLRPLHP